MTVVALPCTLSFPDDESPQPQERTDQESPGHGLIERQQTALERSGACPIRLPHIVRLGINPRNGQIDVAMMRGMALAIERIRKPQTQGRKHHRETQPCRYAAERMDSLMLEREVPCDEVGAHRHDDPPGQ